MARGSTGPALGALAALLLTALAPAGSAEWASFHHDDLNSGYVSGTAYKPFEIVGWSVKNTTYAIDAGAAVSGDLVLVANWGGNLSAYHLEDGRLEWSVKFPGRISGTPAISDDRAFAVDDKGNLKVIQMTTGHTLATASVGPTYAPPTLHEGKLYIGNEAGQLRAFDTQSLTLLWTFDIQSVAQSTYSPPPPSPAGQSGTCKTATHHPAGQIRAAPVVIGGQVIFGSLNHYIYAVDEFGNPDKTSFARWYYQTGDAVFASASVDAASGRVVIGSYDQSVYAFDGNDQYSISSTCPSPAIPSPLWQFDVPAGVGQSRVHSTAAIDGERVYVGSNNGLLYALDLESGEQVWAYATNAAIISSPSVSNGHVVFGSDDGRVYWLRSGNGTLESIYDARSPVKSSPGLDGNRTYITTFDGRLIMLGPKPPLRANLYVSAFDVSETAMSLTVRNDGQARSVPTKLAVTMDDNEFTSFQLAVIGPGNETTVRLDATIPPGDHRFLATLDGAHAVVELNEADNTATATLNVPLPVTATTGTTPTGNQPSDDGTGKVRVPGVSLVVMALALLLLARRGGRLG